jgi:hypothetical protein
VIAARFVGLCCVIEEAEQQQQQFLFDNDD